MPLAQHSETPHAADLQVASTGDLREVFQTPPACYGPVPFYWWAGDKLDRTRIAWQLDQLCEKGVRQTVISYPHQPDSTCAVGDPALFSPEWWDLFRWFLAECRNRGMTVGFQDYTLVTPILEAIGRNTPGMQGGQMGCVAQSVADQQTAVLTSELGTLVVGAWAYPVVNGTPDPQAATSLQDQVESGVLQWTAPAGDWFVALVFARLSPFDPLHPESGKLAIEQLYAPFERECPEEIGKTFNLFFQDELDFGSRTPFWSDRLFDAFDAQHHYDVYPLLPTLWHDFGPVTEKIRLDFSDLVVRLVQDCYFEPVFRWHDARGMMFGHDNMGRGRIAQGRSHYGDYFRTMRWYSAPGCDDPKLACARSFKGIKVNSSIANLYKRPRVWVEAFHSSGWGTAPAEVLAALHEDFAYGANLVNLHGLYYSTRGGWWEWAPPDFHFRQPYWQHSEIFNDYLTRLCWLLSQGVHRCDVAIVYPIASLEAEPADTTPCGLIAHIGNGEIHDGEEALPQTEASAFALGKYLTDHACDFDFIDFESIAEAVAGEGEIRISGMSYRVLILPAMATSRWSTLVKVRDFVHAGGSVIAFGCLPHASERAGREDPQLEELLVEIFGAEDGKRDLMKRHAGGGLACLLHHDFAKVLETINGTIERDVFSSVPLQVLHRQLEDMDVYYVFNPAKEMITTSLTLRARGEVAQWDARTGEIFAISREHLQEFTLAPGEAKVLVIDSRTSASEALELSPLLAEKRVETLDGLWDFAIQPTMDNRFGDFSLPATDGLLGPEARRFRYADETAEDLKSADAWQSATFDDSAWQEVTYSFGARLEATGPLPPDSDFQSIENSLLENGARRDWQPYAFSLRWGIERDPFLTDWLSGPHGLKGSVPNEFLDFHSDVPGTVWYLRAQVVSDQARDTPMVAGGRCAYHVWVNGSTALEQRVALPAGIFAPWSIPHYDGETRDARVRLQAGTNQLLIKLVQPIGQRTRAFVAFQPPVACPETLALRWFTDPSAPRPCLLAAATRRAIRFRFLSPPGTREMTFIARGPAQAWSNGKKLALSVIESLDNGSIRYHGESSDASPGCAVIALRIEAPLDCHAGDALPEPVRFVCGPARISLGDWSDHGLATYSGAAIYSKKFDVHSSQSRISVDLGALNATAEVSVNGHLAATLVAPPWRVDLTNFVHPGTNELSITVANTLANHYSVGIPTPYAFSSQTASGIFGPVRIILS